MAVRKILTGPDERLRTVCPPVADRGLVRPDRRYVRHDLRRTRTRVGSTANQGDVPGIRDGYPLRGWGKDAWGADQSGNHPGIR